MMLLAYRMRFKKVIQQSIGQGNLYDNGFEWFTPLSLSYSSDDDLFVDVLEMDLKRRAS